ncbi:TPA: hypothetical protein ACH3X2_000663 [Trebouxia sp. C0005]
MTHTAKQRGQPLFQRNRTCSSPVPCKLVNRTFEGIVLLPEALVSPDTMSNSRPLTRKRRAETSPVIDQPGTVAVVQPKSSKRAHPQLHGYTSPVSKTFGPQDTLNGAVPKNTPTASGHDYSKCSLDCSAVLQAALTLKPANVAADPRGFQMATAVEAVMAGCKVPMPNSHGLPAVLQARSHAAPVAQQIRKHIARQLASISHSAVWLRHLEQVRCRTPACTPADGFALPACNPKQGRFPVALDMATLQHTADNKAPTSRQEDAASGMNGTHRKQSSVLPGHQRCLQESPIGSMLTSGSSRPPWDSSSQGTQSIKRSVSIGRLEDAGGGDTDSPQAVHRLLASMKRPFVGAAHRSIKKINADYRSHVEYRQQSGYMQCASDLH